MKKQKNNNPGSNKERGKQFKGSKHLKRGKDKQVLMKKRRKKNTKNKIKKRNSKKATAGKMGNTSANSKTETKIENENAHLQIARQILHSFVTK